MGFRMQSYIFVSVRSFLLLYWFSIKNRNQKNTLDALECRKGLLFDELSKEGQETKINKNTNEIQTCWNVVKSFIGQ